MSDQHRVDEGSSRRSSEGISDVQDRPEGSSQNDGSKMRQSDEEKPKEMETGKENVNSDSIGVEPLLSPGIQEEAGVEGDRGAKKSRPDAGLKTGNDPFNYEDKYPEDNIYEETAPNARIWRTYLDESTNHDVRMVGESRDSVDVLLVFAGLFSAVVSASLLFEMVLIQRAIANGSSLDNVPASSLSPYAKFTPATTDVWVNGLWFTSLSLSLATALVAVLVKQWLHHYLALPSGTPQERSHVRQYRYGGFQKWHVLVIVGLLPVLMHLALGIFFVGLTVFLVPLRPGLSWVIGAGTVAAYTTYLITIFLPILYPQCPYRTPLSDLVYFPYHYITQDLFPKHVRPLFVKEGQLHNFTLEEPGAKISSLDDLERGVVREESETLSVEALHWLFSSSSNPTVHGIVIQSIGGLPLSARAAVKKVFGEATHIREAHNTLLYGSTQYLGGRSLKPSSGMESKVERLLRFELFIPHLYDDMDNETRARFYVDAADDDQGLTVVVQSNDTLQRSKYKPPDSPTSTAFFQQVTHSHPVMLPPVIWLELMRMAKDDGAFAPIDIDSLDDFPMHLCSYIAPWNMQMLKGTSPCVYFEIATREYFVEEFTANMLNMISAFDKLADKTSFPPTFTLALASVRYLLHRISLSSFDIDTQHTLRIRLRVLEGYVAFNNPPHEQIAALSDLVEHVVIHSPVFKLGPEWTGPQMTLVEVYSAMVGTSSLHLPGYCPKHDFWPALRPLVEFLINQYDAPYDANWYSHAPFDTMCDILGLGLRHGVETVYDVFLETRCLDVFGGHSLRPSLVSVINGYVTGLAAPHAPIDSQRHLDYLHEPENLFLACCILATNGWNAFSETPSMLVIPPARLSRDICSDIRALASLRPSDPSWDQCRRKLRDLLQDDGGDFFGKQQKWTMHGFEVLKPEAIDEAKSNIRLALCELDGLFSDSKNTNVRYSMHPRESMAWRFLGRMYQYLRYPRRREKDEVQV
ncbi:uncharacterized protein ARMOST_01535 [Armillaria ostoyae]|uniref:DUF6535 domain-containing protein n=1 Tax=Armillaria ostoyae TaxID=47428 RepID=A0A284QP78_ARMOS|nr:uncharacterized protein ARMOST_01535 [Armillaria ostoyae]